MAHKIPTGNVKKRRRNTSFDMNPEQEQDGSQDSPPYNGVTSPQEPGLSTIDFNFDMGTDSELQSALVRDSGPLDEDIDRKISKRTNDTYGPKKKELLVPDNYEVDGEQQQKVDEKSEEEYTEEESSVNENSESEEESEDEDKQSDDDNEDLCDNSKNQEDKTLDEVSFANSFNQVNEFKL